MAINLVYWSLPVKKIRFNDRPQRILLKDRAKYQDILDAKNTHALLAIEVLSQTDTREIIGRLAIKVNRNRAGDPITLSIIYSNLPQFF